MTWWEILIIVLIAAFVVGYIAYAIVRRKQGKGGCDCCGGCSGCSDCSACRPKPEDDTQQSTHNNLPFSQDLWRLLCVFRMPSQTGG